MGDPAQSLGQQGGIQENFMLLVSVVAMVTLETLHCLVHGAVEGVLAV